VREVSDQEFQAYIEENILDALDMSNTCACYPEELMGEELAIGYSGLSRDGTRTALGPFSAGPITPAVGFTSSVVDLAKFASWQFRLLEEGGDEVLELETLREMHRVQWATAGSSTTRGLGFNIWRVGDTTVIGHSGGCPGYSTNLMMYVKEKISTIALTNVAGGDPDSITGSMMKIISAALEKAKTPSKETMPDLSMYEGIYNELPTWGGEVAIRQWGDHLVRFRIPSDALSVTKLEHIDGHTFAAAGGSKTPDGAPQNPYVFQMGDDGKAKGYLVEAGSYVRIE
jgi:CubicO group peptidase (beta-lactamase class C family)